MTDSSAAGRAEEAVARVRDDPEGRLELMRRLYESSAGNTPHLPYRRAAVAFMRWQLRRGVLSPPGAERPGSPWWRALNEGLLRDTAEARFLVAGAPGTPSSPAVDAVIDFIHEPSAAGWYRAHNCSIAHGYLAHRELAEDEGRVERFFLNVVLLRVLYAHALGGAPRTALGWLGPIAPALGDPRLGTTAIFLSLSRILPDRYPLEDDVAPYLSGEQTLGRVLDKGIIQPRLRVLYDWAATELGLPGVAGLLVDDAPAYAWDPTDVGVWNSDPKWLARLARRVVPPG